MAYDGDTPEIPELLALAGDDAKARTWTMLPGVLVSYSGEDGAVVQPVLRDPTADGEGQVMPQIHCAPLWIYAAAGAVVRLPDPQPGDRCLIFISSVSLSPWVIDGQANPAPENGRRHSITDAIVIPGLRPLSEAYASDPTKITIGLDDDESDNGPLRITIDPASRDITLKGGTVTIDPETTVKLGANAAARPVTTAEAKTWFDAIGATLRSLAGATFATPYPLDPTEDQLTSATKTLIE